jgi:hypothetical protein
MGKTFLNKKESDLSGKNKMSLLNLYKKQSKLRKLKKTLNKNKFNFENILTIYI